MSLLLEALRKAEKAKDEAKRQAEMRDSGDSGFTLVGDAPGTGNKHVVTRDELPDISQPLEILSEDITASESGAPASGPPASLELMPEPAPAPEPTPRPAPPAARAPSRAASTAPEPRNAARAAAKNLFDAKFREPNPKLPFYITMGVLGVITVGTVIYFWIQLRPPAPLVTANPTRPANEKPVETASPAKPAAASSESQPAAPAAQIPGLPEAAPAKAAAPPPAPAKPSPAAPAAPSAPAVAAAPTPAAKAAAPPKPAPRAAPSGAARAPTAGTATTSKGRARAAPIAIPHAAPKVHPSLERGYAAYQSGNFAAAREAYLEALKDEPSSRDALLGMAALEVRAGRFETADGYYQRLLRADPRDPDAHAGTLALRSQFIDPVQAESRVKSLLASNPDAHALNFSLGNQYAQQARWAEAQQAYFRAFTADPENPDYSYNLAVSLDQLRQPQLALDYYRRALALAQTRAANFDQALARNRIQVLAQSAR